MHLRQHRRSRRGERQLSRTGNGDILRTTRGRPPGERKKENERMRVVNVTRVTLTISQYCCPVLFAFIDLLPSLRIWRLDEELHLFDLRAGIICYSCGARASPREKRKEKRGSRYASEICSVTFREPWKGGMIATDRGREKRWEKRDIVLVAWLEVLSTQVCRCWRPPFFRARNI